MKEPLFRKILIGVTIAGLLCTGALTALTVYLYGNISIISFIGNGR